MLKLQQFILGNYQTNCYCLSGDATPNICCMIDPGFQPEEILTWLEQNKMTLEAILLTHGHFDHVGAVRELAAETGCRVYIHADDLRLPPMITAGKLYYTDTYGEGDTLQIAGLTFGVLHTPGHTPGSVCLTVEDCLFSGDTLFANSCGRTDLPGGSHRTILRSLQRLAQLPNGYRVFPGHGESTTLAQEKRYNPYL